MKIEFSGSVNLLGDKDRSVKMSTGLLPFPTGSLAVKKLSSPLSGLVPDYEGGHYQRNRESLLLKNKHYTRPVQHKVLSWAKKHINKDAPRWWYNLVIGHDLHLSVFAELYVKHYHATQRDPFTGELGWWENVGLVSKGKVTTAFRDDLVATLLAVGTTFDDYKFHEVGTSATAEANTQTALSTTSGIARVSGTQVNVGGGVYRSVATVTADTTETWQEHGIFNIVSAGTMMDRSLISPTVAVVNLDTVQFTYELTVNAEP